MRTIDLCTIAAFALALSTPACTRGPAPSHGRPAIRIQISSEPVTLDPARAEDGIALRILANTMQGLYRRDAHGRPIPALAESAEVSEDRRTYRFKIRAGARWSDGVPVQAEDFVRGFRHSLDPRTASKLAPLFLSIRGAKEVISGKAQPETLGVRVAGRDLVIELEKPVSFFLDLLTLSPALPSRGEFREDGPVTGAYRLVQRAPGQWLRFEPVMAPGSSDLLPIELVVVSDESTGIHLFEKSSLDLVTRVPSYDLERWSRSGRLVSAPMLATFYLAFNTRKPPFRDPALRREVAQAIRKQELVQALGTSERVAGSWIPPGLDGRIDALAPSPAPLKKDPSLRQRLSRLAFTLGSDSGARNSLVLEKIQHDLQSALGCKVSLRQAEWRTYIRWLETDPPQLYRFGWLSPILDPVPHLEVFTTGNPNNYTGWSSPAYDALVTRISALEPGVERSELISQAEQLLEREAVVIPLYHYVQTYLVAKTLQGFTVDPMSVVDWSSLRRAPSS